MPDSTPPTRSERPELDLPAGLAVTTGAVLGAVAGYLLLTRRGARLRHDLDGVVDRWSASVDTVLDGWQRTRRHGESASPSLPFDDADEHVASRDQTRHRRSS